MDSCKGVSKFLLVRHFGGLRANCINSTEANS